MKPSRILAYAQLMRLPNVFTLIADVSMALCAIAATSPRWEAQVLIMLGSICFYLGGMVHNDYSDRKEDSKTQSFRPIPSGRVSLQSVTTFGILLFFAGFAFSHFAFSMSNRLVDQGWFGSLFIAIVFYNSLLKHTFIGPIAMGSCRFLNIMMVLSLGSLQLWLSLHIAGIVGIYIVGITWFSRSEEMASQRWQLIAAALTMVVSIILAMLLPMHFPAGTVPFYYLILMSVFVLMIAGPLLAAVMTPSAKLVQVAVKSSIMALILLDATLATAFVGWPGLLIVLLLIPATRLGKWVYST